jgi:transposase-like protein
VTFLTDFIKKGQKNARPLTRARILLLANQEKGDTEIAKILGVGRNTALRIRKNTLKKAYKVLWGINQDPVNLKNIMKGMLQK